MAIKLVEKTQQQCPSVSLTRLGPSASIPAKVLFLTIVYHRPENYDFAYRGVMWSAGHANRLIHHSVLRNDLWFQCDVPLFQWILVLLIQIGCMAADRQLSRRINQKTKIEWKVWRVWKVWKVWKDEGPVSGR